MAIPGCKKSQIMNIIKVFCIERSSGNTLCGLVLLAVDKSCLPFPSVLAVAQCCLVLVTAAHCYLLLTNVSCRCLQLLAVVYC